MMRWTKEEDPLAVGVNLAPQYPRSGAMTADVAGL